MKRNKCPICGDFSLEEETIFHRDFSGARDIVPFQSYEVKRCASCGFVYAGNIIQERPIAEYYACMSKYDSGYYFDEERYERETAFLLKYLQEDNRILDIGCAGGGLLRALQQEGFSDLTGLEPSAQNVNFIRQTYAIPAYVGGLGMPLPKEVGGHCFDVIILSNVLEHIMFLQENLKYSKDLLAKNGRVYIEVPDLEQFDLIKDLYQQFSFEHINYFNRNSLSNLMFQYGFQLVGYEQHAFNLYSLWKSVEVVKKDCTYDDTGEKKLRQYLANAKVVSEAVRQKMATLDRKVPIYIWGAGTHTAMMYQLGLLAGYKVLKIIDINKNYEGHEIYGCTIINPQEYIDPAYQIVISSQFAQDSIEDWIKNKLKLSNRVIKLY